MGRGNFCRTRWAERGGGDGRLFQKTRPDPIGPASCVFPAGGTWACGRNGAICQGRLLRASPRLAQPRTTTVARGDEQSEFRRCLAFSGHSDCGADIFPINPKIETSLSSINPSPKGLKGLRSDLECRRRRSPHDINAAYHSPVAKNSPSPRKRENRIGRMSWDPAEPQSRSGDRSKSWGRAGGTSIAARRRKRPSPRANHSFGGTPPFNSDITARSGQRRWLQKVLFGWG